MPGPKERSNFTDANSHIMKSRRVQGDNADVMVSEASGANVAQEVRGHSVDRPRLKLMLEQRKANREVVGVLAATRRSGVYSAGTGYCSASNLARLKERRIDAHLATGRERYAWCGWTRSASRPAHRSVRRCARN